MNLSKTQEPQELMRLSLSLTVVIFAWGSNYALVKLALRDISPFTFNAIRFGGAALLIGLCLWLRRARMLPEPDERARLTLVGLCQVSMMLGASSVALLWLDASLVVLIAYTMPVWALLFERVMLGRRITPLRMISTILGIGGLAVVLSPTYGNWNTLTYWQGVGCALAATIGWALGSTLYRTRIWRSSYWSQVMWQTLIGATPLVLIALLFESNDDIRPTPTLLGLILYNWLIPASLAYWCWSQVLARVPVVFAGQFLLLAPVVGVGMAHVVLSETVGSDLFLGGALILAAALIAIKTKASD